MGVKPGDPVACFFRNSPRVVWVASGISAAGAAEVVLDPSLGDDNLAYMCRLGGIRTVVGAIALEAIVSRPKFG